MEHDTQNAASYRNHPLVIIAGRPNTGKSTLFNRLLHKRRVITDPTPGVTRDPVEETALIRGKPVRIMDTGGFKLTRTAGSPEAVLDDLVTEKTLDALKKADLILLLLDAEAVTPEDEEFHRAFTAALGPCCRGGKQNRRRTFGKRSAGVLPIRF